MDLIYTAKRGKQIVFDDFEDNTEEYQSYWVEMCPHCHNKYKGILGKRASHGAIGTCSVKGCENEAEYYVDFEETKVTHSIDDLIGMELNFTELDKIMTLCGFFSEQEIILSDNALGKIIEDGYICYIHKKKNDEPGELVHLTFEVTIMASKVEDLSATMVKITEIENPKYAFLSGVDSDVNNECTALIREYIRKKFFKKNELEELI